jgi:hypothetical protein
MPLLRLERALVPAFVVAEAAAERRPRSKRKGLRESCIRCGRRISNQSRLSMMVTFRVDGRRDQRRAAYCENEDGSGRGTSTNHVARTAAAGPTRKTNRHAMPFQLVFARSYTWRYVTGSLRLGLSILVLTNNSLLSGESA